jgi:DNA polymerase III alpha subunit (gram-positive type)
MNNRYLAFDCESGGVTTDMSLLTVYFQVLDDKFNVLDELALAVKPNDGKYLVNAEAMQVNKINLIDHDRVAITYSKAGQELRNFLLKNSLLRKSKLIPIGKNVDFDISFVTTHLLGKNTWNEFVSYRVLEVTTIALVEQMKGTLPPGSISLSALVEHFNIKVDGKLHEADYDTKATVAVMRKLIGL